MSVPNHQNKCWPTTNHYHIFAYWNLHVSTIELTCDKSQTEAGADNTASRALNCPWAAAVCHADCDDIFAAGGWRWKPLLAASSLSPADSFCPWLVVDHHIRLCRDNTAHTANPWAGKAAAWRFLWIAQTPTGIPPALPDIWQCVESSWQTS